MKATSNSRSSLLLVAFNIAELEFAAYSHGEGEKHSAKIRLNIKTILPEATKVTSYSGYFQH